MKRLALFAVAIASLSLVTLALGANTFAVKVVKLPTRLHVIAHYQVAAPSDCPAVAPEISDPNWDALFAAWSSDHCQPYRLQQADLLVIVKANGKIVYRTDWQGIGNLTPTSGAGVDEGIWFYSIPCVHPKARPRTSIPYTITVSLLDPYGGPPVSRTSSFRRC